MEREFRISILGCSAATPTSLRHTTAQIVKYHNAYFLLDCAEGTQMQLRRMKIPLMRINHIFISHLHGDHYLGLPGLLFSLHLLGRKKELHIYSPPGLQQIIDVHYTTSGLKPSFKTTFHDIQQGGERLYHDKYLCIDSIEMVHRITCYGFKVSEKAPERNIKKEGILKYTIPVQSMQSIKMGEDFLTADGEIIPNCELTTEPHKPRSYAFCSDTAYTESFLQQITGADVLYHEATFLEEHAAIAREKTHSTALEAATLAKKAGVRKLLLGHYSARYKDLSDFEKEARSVFPESYIVQEGDAVDIQG
jgi:ribonuclease Z